MAITTLMTLMGAVTMFTSWAIINHRINTSPNDVGIQVRLLKNFFLHMGIFTTIMFLPHLLLTTNPDSFPLAMTWGYIIGHVFLYIALINVLRLTFSMAPRLASKEKLAITSAIMVSILITTANIVTMAYGTKPSHDFERQVTFFNAAPVVGASIALFAMISVFPAAILMIRNGIQNPAARVRSYLLGGGLLILMTAGPLHDNAKTWQLYVIADVVSIVALLLVMSGVVYRIEERLMAPASASPAQ